MLWKPTTLSSSPARRWLAPAIFSLSAMPLALFTPGTLPDPQPAIAAAVRPAMNAAHSLGPARCGEVCSKLLMAQASSSTKLGTCRC